MTQDDLAGKIELSRSSLANIEIGRQRLPLFSIYQIAEALGVDVMDLLPTIEQLRAIQSGNDVLPFDHSLFTDEQLKWIYDVIAAGKRTPDPDLSDSFIKICSFEGCTNDASVRGLCPKHYQRFRKRGSLDVKPHKQKQERARCSVCGRKAVARQLCVAHYQELRRQNGGRLTPKTNEITNKK